VWPARPTRAAGRLIVESVLVDAEPVIFDPTNVPDGVALPDDDEILQLRSAAYGLSYATRTGS
jgi:catalase